MAPDRLRFDFSHYEPVSTEQIAEIESIVNNEIRRNVAADTKLMSYDDAVESGAIALFGEKYEDEVRVLNFGGFSIELCGGTHVDRTGDIGVFKITHETGIASGVAQTALQAQQVARRRDKRSQQASGESERVREMIEAHMRALEEGDEATLGSVTQLHVDSELPQHQSPPPVLPEEQISQQQVSGEAIEPVQPVPAPPTQNQADADDAKHPPRDGQLYQQHKFLSHGHE